MVCIIVWCGTFIFLTFGLNDLLLVSLLIIAISVYFTGYSAALQQMNAIIFFAGVLLGRGASVLFSGKLEREERNVENQKSVIQIFLNGLVMLLAFSALWHIDTSTNVYHGPRWMGIWNNPNTYGMLMGVGLLLAIELFTKKQKEGFRINKLLPVALLVSGGLTAAGLIFSYSRGAWLGAVVGMLYLAKAHGKFKWFFILPGILIVAAVVYFFWGATADDAPWYLKRADLSRPSAQHRVAAWKAGFEIMRDHPFGVGWNKAVDIYKKSYLPPENGATAITTNDYLMMGTQLGLPALFCFIAYIYSKFKPNAADSLQVACRAGAVVLLVAFWFDGGLFDLPTATVFWILLELGTSRARKVEF